MGVHSKQSTNIKESSVKRTKSPCSRKSKLDKSSQKKLSLSFVNARSVMFSIDRKILKSHLSCLDNYKVLSVLGEGSYGKVLLAESIFCGKKVAIKCLPKSSTDFTSSVGSALREIKILKMICHENVIQLFETFEENNIFFAVLELASRGDLLTLVKKQKRLTESEFLPIFIQTVQGLHYLHSKQILHRDIKLDNLLLTENGRVKICDFGISLQTKKGRLIFEHIGTPAYLSPEIIRGKGYSGFKSDVWSLGVTLFIALTGKGPFKGSGIEELQENILRDDFVFPENTKISSVMRHLIGRMLEKNIAKRISLNEIAELLDFDLEAEDCWGQQKTLNTKKLEVIASFGFDADRVATDIKKGLMNHPVALYKMM